MDDYSATLRYYVHVVLAPVGHSDDEGCVVIIQTSQMSLHLIGASQVSRV